MNALESNGSTGLHVACFRGHRDIVKLLLEKGVSRTVINIFRCIPYEEAPSNEIRQLFERTPSNNRYVANSGRIEWLLVALNTTAMSARHIAALEQQYRQEAQQFEACVRQIIDNYIKTRFRDVEHYDELLGHFNAALRHRDPQYLLKAYTAETGFYTRLNGDLAGENDIGKRERQLYVSILAFHPDFDRYRFAAEAYRGMRLTDDDLRDYQVGAKVMTKSFLSATTDKDEAKSFVARIQRHNIHGQAVKRGVICTYIIRNRQSALDAHELSEYQNEKEILIFPYPVFAVTRIHGYPQTNADEYIEITLTQTQ
jgi:hypothetical protein